ncbi:peptidoglycan glycosyltransferase [Alicyclobacillaceae bacterium I2511]|nr:peptidoglycan glycosyltransferase [Alicyclobacillaceae bacterium I2511]
MKTNLEESFQKHLQKYRWRSHWIYALVVFAFGSLILRLGYLQITQGQNFRVEAVQQATETLPVLAARGRIYDSSGNLLAYDKPVYSVYFTKISGVNDTPQAIVQIANTLAATFHTSPSTLVQTMDNNSQFSTFRLITDINLAQLAFISEYHTQLPGISVEMDGQRTYTYGDLAGQVLGYVGNISKSQQEYYIHQKKYLWIQQVGVSGIEQEYESILQGKVGYEAIQYNRDSGQVVPMGYTQAPQAGDNLQLTLDGRLQADTQNAVLQAIKQYENQTHTQITDAAAVMIDVKTGGVLSMVSYPYFDPNWYVNGTFTKHTNYLQQSGAEMNNAIQNPHYPGSTVKPANLITGLEQGVITPNTVYDDASPYMWIGNYPIREDASYGLVDDRKAIAVSDDRFFYSLGLALGHWLGSSETSGGYPAGGDLQQWRNTPFMQGILSLAKGELQFGLGSHTGIDLPGEQSGTFYIENQSTSPSTTIPLQLPTVEAAMKVHGAYLNYGSPLDLAFMAFGQSQQFTPIELAQYVATLADNGQKLQPHLLQAVLPPGVDPVLNGTIPMGTKEFRPVVQATLNIPTNDLKLAQQGMYDACNQPYGTAYGSFGNAPYKAAGKTGTAEIVMNGQAINNSVFIGYAPYNNPQVAVAIMVPGAGYGATTAVPIARQMMDDYFEEHHSTYFSKNQWQPTQIPSGWTHSIAYLLPEQSS